VVNTKKMARRLAMHGDTCTQVRQGLGRLAPCQCGKSLAWVCGCGDVIIVRGGACGEWQADAASRNALVVYR
jgi:hypothetical protein